MKEFCRIRAGCRNDTYVFHKVMRLISHGNQAICVAGTFNKFMSPINRPISYRAE